MQTKFEEEIVHLRMSARRLWQSTTLCKDKPGITALHANRTSQLRRPLNDILSASSSYSTMLPRFIQQFQESLTWHPTLNWKLITLNAFGSDDTESKHSSVPLLALISTESINKEDFTLNVNTWAISYMVPWRAIWRYMLWILCKDSYECCYQPL